ncbi:quinolinate synthase NadA [Hyperthermus butylicus]|uniref:quinolinate synthase NadA n=1 Tax=Hyperthermus butylicus TaxID=54248 RepID=UPI001E56D877|nr:quinolinate synthase NadA [Hyperthermus butylicus]
MTGNGLEAILERIRELKEKRRAVILAHNYQLPEIQDIADFVGDSLELARKAMEVDADVIVMAAVNFMAEVAAILNPDKIVLHPDPRATCPLANHARLELLRRYREKYPGAPLVIYINSYAVAKAYADYIVTSASAVKLVGKLGEDTILFAPDRNLADHVAMATGKNVVAVPAGGICPVHEFLLDEYYVRKVREQYPRGYLMVHPETPRPVRLMADYVGSTSQMLRRIGEVEAEVYIIGTEEGLVHRARRLYPDKKIVPANPRAVCINMKKITPLKILYSLETLKPRVVVPEPIARRVREILERSLEMVR